MSVLHIRGLRPFRPARQQAPGLFQIFWSRKSRGTTLPSLALLSLVLPVVPFAEPARVSDYRQTTAAFIAGLAWDGGAFVGMPVPPPVSFRWLSVVLAILGTLFSAYLLWALIGTCSIPKR
jgi:hypothetical protein